MVPMSRSGTEWSTAIWVFGPYGSRRSPTSRMSPTDARMTGAASASATFGGRRRMAMPSCRTGTRPKTSRGTTFTAERTDMCACAPRSTRSIACSHAELPNPTTRTGRPFHGSPLRYSLECTTVPPNVSRPGHVGRTGRRNAPVATTTSRARHTSSAVVATHSPSMRSRLVTRRPNSGSMRWCAR